MDVFYAIAAVCLPVLSAWSLLRVVAALRLRQNPRVRDLVAMAVWADIARHVGKHGGPHWLEPASTVLFAALLLLGLVMGIIGLRQLIVTRRDPGTAPAKLRQRTLTLVRADMVDSFLFGVAHDGAVILPGLPPSTDESPARVRLDEGCAFCFVEDVLGELLDGDVGPHVQEYRRNLSRGENRVFVVGHLTGDPRWKAEIHTLAGEEERPPVTCAVHVPAS